MTKPVDIPKITIINVVSAMTGQVRQILVVKR